jgi:hypothetical protein
MTEQVGRILIRDRQIHGEPQRDFAIGDTFDVIRVDGPRKGDHMGTAVVTRVDEDGNPEITVHLGGQPGG